MAIGEVISQQQLQDLQKWNQQSLPKQAYIAPTVYRLANSTFTKWPYFKTIEQAIQYIKFLGRVKGVRIPVSAGNVPFQNLKKAQTLGINVDFYWPFDVIGALPVPYTFVRTKLTQKGNVVLPFKFYKTNGSGPYYSVLVSTELGISATVTAKLSQDKIVQYDRLTREVALLRANYNALASFLNDLSKQTLTPIQQQIFNEGILRLGEYKEQIRQIKDIDFTFGKNSQVGAVGVLPVVVYWLIFWAVTAVIAAYTVQRIAAKWAEVQKIRSDNDTIQFLTDAKIRIASDNTLTEAQKRELTNGIDKSITRVEDHKTTVEENAAKPGIFDQVVGLAKWGLVFYGIKTIGEVIVAKKSK